MKISIKPLFFLILLSISMNAAHAQSSMRFDKYGVYLVENGITKEILTEHDSLIERAYFWENYLILDGSSLESYIYNRETGESNYIESGSVIKLELGTRLRAYMYLSSPVWTDKSGQSHYEPILGKYCIFEYDPDTLELKNIIPLPKRPFPELKSMSYLYDVEEKIHYQPATKEIIDDRFYRYRGKNFYLDVYGSTDFYKNGDYFHTIVFGGNENVFVVSRTIAWGGH